ncbi:MAG TPA: TonB-dependent receptor plug domain-containing protein [Opitutaceae bacterium]|nr:TonB-dependent receptor plug domain-containing protein [Opitutaceae bacterium]
MKKPSPKTALLLATASVCQLALAQTAPSNATGSNSSEEEIITLSPFEVSSAKDTGYAATETLAGTRIRTDLKDVASSISVVTKEFMTDIGATDSATLLQYTPNAEVAGTRGTYAGLGNATGVDETAVLRNPNLNNRVRGLATADNTRDFFVTDIPWDSYNVDRVDIQRGPNSILFGLGSPAGIVNASINNATFRNLGNVEYRFGSYGTQRASLDLNQELIKNVLAVRVDGLWSEEKYQQDPAFQHTKREFAAIRFDPDLFKNRAFHTSFKAKYEHGDISANRPRITPPTDSISAWFRPVDTTSMNGGMGKLSITDPYAPGANPASLNPWLSAYGNQQQPIWFIDGTTNKLYQIYGGYVNAGALDNAGKNRGSGNSLIGQRFSNEFYNLTNLSSYATNAKIAGYQYGQYRNQSLQDSSIFDFYNNLIDGPTKKEWERWTAYNLDFSQTAWDDRLGVEVSYDKQKYRRGGQQLLNNPQLTIDIQQTNQDLTANPNFGRPYVTAGPGSGSSYESDRRYLRGSLFGELRASDFFKNEFLVKLLGRQRLNGVFSDEDYKTENRSWNMYANSQEWAAYWTQTTGASSDFKDRPPISAIYLGPSLASASSASGANIPGITAPIVLNSGNVYQFNATYLNPPGVALTDPWTVPSNLLTVFDPATATTQASNPANYIGWNTNVVDKLLVYADGADPRLTTVAQKNQRTTRSWAGSWQGYLWNDAIVPTLGWRYDQVKGRGVTAAPVTANRAMLNLDPTTYKLPDAYPDNQIFKDHSTAGGVVVHFNKLLGSHDILPLNISASYNRSNNFQVTDIRRDIYGKPLANPTGSTKEYSVLLSTKDGKYSFRVTKYKTGIVNDSTSVDLTGLAGAITQGIKFRNVFLYQMSGYTWDTREQTVQNPGQRYFWTPAYINAAGRPVADLNGSPTPPAGATLETQAEADAHRDASIRAWNDIQKTLDAKGFFSAWNYTPTTLAALTDRATYAATLTTNGSPDGKPIPAAQYMPAIASLASYTATRPSGLTVTSDTQSKGYEFELVANPTPNWRLLFNASETEAVRSNVGGADLDSLVAYMDLQMAGIAGDMRQFNGNYVASNEVRQNYANWRGQYTLLKLQEGASVSELRKWRYNVVTNYSFTHGAIKGLGIGASYRWQDRVVIGYPVISGANGQASFDLSKPFYGPSEDAFDAWISYERKLTKRLTWKIQLNGRNLFGKEELIPISVEPDGKTWAAARIAPNREWFVTNTLEF